jgi:DNA-binding CsgD family transcriptional regulator
MLQDELLAIGQQASVADWEATLVALSARLGFDRVSAGLAVERARDIPHFAMVGNTPPAFLARSRDRETGLRDPVIQQLKRSHCPFVYTQAMYVDAGAAPLWEEQAPYGYKTGIALAMHLPQGRHFVFGVDRDQALPDDDAEVVRMMADVQLLAAFTVTSALNWLDLPEAAEAPGANHPTLSPREVEVLRWTLEGKSSWAVGRILGVSESTVNFHLRNAMRRLGASSKHVAAMRAATLGLLGM